MDPLTHSAVSKARDALNLALTDAVMLSSAEVAAGKRKAFVSYCLHHLAAGPQGPDWSGASPFVRRYVERAGASMRGELLDESDDLMLHWLGGIADFSLLDSLKLYGVTVPPQVRRMLLASGSVGTTTPEAGLRLVKKLLISQSEVEPLKALAAIAVTREMVNAGGPRFLAMFEKELASAVTKVSNDEVLAQVAAMAGSDQIAIASTGDPLTDLRAGLQAADPSYGYVVAASPGQVADLATRIEALPGFSVRGGEFRPGIRIVAVDGHVGMTVIPASKLAIFDLGLEIRGAGDATVDMADDDESPAVLVSLWQTGTLGLLAERHFHIGGQVVPVTVGGPT